MDTSCEDMAPRERHGQQESRGGRRSVGAPGYEGGEGFFPVLPSFLSENLTALSKAPRPCGLLAQSHHATGSRLFCPLCCVLEPNGGS